MRPKHRSRALPTVLIATLALPMMAQAEALRQNAISPTRAGAFFASICFDIYPDVARAQKAAQQNGFRYNPETKLFEDARRDRQMRINKKRCALRFLTRAKPGQIGAEFGEASVASAKSKNLPSNVDIGTEHAGNGLIRVAARLDR